ncbi:hypothetical protein [Chromobacterium piscinae]|uniref:hypothetical protein n=1 Tax=Chromobacterium piscinae TaxID=686831 RepID=UPI003F803AE4
MITFVNAVNRDGDAHVSVQINDLHIFRFIMTREAIFDFLGGLREREMSSSEALHRHWDQFKPAIEEVLRRHGSRFEVLTTEMLNP